MQVFSYSRLDKFNRCPAAFYKHYVDGAVEPPTEPLVLGKACHAVIEAALKAGAEDKGFFELTAQVVAGVSPLKVDPEEVLELTYQPLVLNQIDERNRVEEHFIVPLDSDDPFGPDLQGHIDLWRDQGDDILLLDWKSNRKTYSPMDTHQLGLYAGYLHQLTGKPVRGRLSFLRAHSSEEHIYESGNGIEQAHRWASETAQNILERLYIVQTGHAAKDEVFPATPGDACRYCAWAPYCNGDEIIVPGEVRSFEEAEKMGREILRLEGAANGLKAVLRPFVEKNGPVQVDSREFRLAPSQYWKFPGEALPNAVNAMKQDSVDPLKILSLTSTGLKKLGWDDARLRSLGADPKQTFTFKHFSIKR